MNNKNTEQWLFYKQKNWIRLFLSEDQKPIHWAKEVENDTVTAIIKHWSEDKYLILDRPTGQKRFLGWWVERWETPRQAIEREIEEESGYIDFTNKGQLWWVVSAYFHHQTKWINLLAHNYCFIIELESETEIEISKEEELKHKKVWIPKEEVGNFCNAPVGKCYRNRYIRGYLVWNSDYNILDEEYIKNYQWEIYHK
jgi:hypothetical protein